MNNKVWVIGFAIILIFLLISLVPLSIIWSLNTLFNLNIEYSFVNFLAALILTSIFSGKATKISKSD